MSRDTRWKAPRVETRGSHVISEIRSWYKNRRSVTRSCIIYKLFLNENDVTNAREEISGVSIFLSLLGNQDCLYL